MAGAINLSENLLRAPANRLSGMWNVTLDPEANVLLSWKPIYEKDYLLIQVRIENLAPQSWFAVGFSEDGHWTESNVCVAWEDWKGYLHVQVRDDCDSLLYSEMQNYTILKLYTNCA